MKECINKLFEDGVNKVQFDFDSGLGLNDDSVDSATSPLHEIGSYDEKSSMATDLEVQKVQSNQQQGGRKQKRHNVEYEEENHNQYIARRFNRTRIEFYLDLLCPPDEILDEEVPTPPLQQPSSPVVSLPHLPNKGPETNSNPSNSMKIVQD